jgi:hypothetical protein
MAIKAEVTITDAAAGAIFISVGADDTAGLDPGYYHDGLRITMARGERFTWHGRLLVDADRFAVSGA